MTDRSFLFESTYAFTLTLINEYRNGKIVGIVNLGN